ncbi:ABC transporter permease [Leucobacter sp.]
MADAFGAMTGGDPRRRSAFRSRPRGWVPAVLSFAVAALLWQVVAWNHPFVLPPLERIAGSLLAAPQMYAANFLITLQEVLVGAAAGVLVGFALAVAMCEFEVVERALMPLIVVLTVTPVIAIAPALVVAFGFGMIPKYVVTALVVFFPMLVNTLAGLRGADPRALEVLRTLHASRWEIFRDLRLPGSTPYVFAGLRISLPLAVVGAAVAEFVAAGRQAGLGSLVMTSAAQANLPVTWASILLLCTLGLLLIAALALVRRRVLWWSDDAAAARQAR